MCLAKISLGSTEGGMGDNSGKEMDGVIDRRKRGFVERRKSREEVGGKGKEGGYRRRERVGRPLG